jgi:polysaccharide deacetylase family protein (PEP-CTERM system associated)
MPEGSAADRTECFQAEGAGYGCNALSIDVEDYFHVSAFAGHIDRADWEAQPQHLQASMEVVLNLLAEQGAHATFFVLGWVAERHPALIRTIVSAGHEVSSHGYAHYRVGEQTPASFAADVRRTRVMLEDIAGVAVKGYRAASFSISEDTFWAFDVLAEAGYAYSSSIYPIRHDHYGIPDAPRFAFRPRGESGILEIPISTIALFGRHLPCGGGGYFRLAPYGLSRWALRRVAKGEGRACVFYFHPWEIDQQQPRPAGLPLKTRFRHYINISRMEARLKRLLTDFRWDRMDRVFQRELGGT